MSYEINELNAGFISCDIIGHSGVKDIAVQKFRIEAINNIVKESISKISDHITWASGGDGGHLIFFTENWHSYAIDYMIRLKDWADKNNVPIRIIGHYGKVIKTVGADNNVQLVGTGINLSGHLLSFGVSGGFVVSEEFKKSFDSSRVEGVSFHSERIVCLKYFNYQKVYLFSINDKILSKWSTIVRLDESFSYNYNQSMIKLADNERRIWDIVYYAKRILQVNANDKTAVEIMHKYDSDNFTYFKEIPPDNIKEQVINPFFKCFGDSTDAILEIIKISQLVEKNRNEIICDLHDDGDSMFIVLNGEIGIFPNGINLKNEINFIEPLFTVTEGEIVGEIAFALKRKRSATLLTIQKTAFLSLNLEQIYALAKNFNIGNEINTGLNRFLKLRLLEFLCDRLDFFVGKKRTGPLSEMNNPWKRMSPFSEKIDYSWQKRKLSQEDEIFNKSGIYILVKGKIKNAYTLEELSCDENFPIVFLNLDSFTSKLKQEYTIEEDITIIFIDIEKFLKKEPKIYNNVSREISKLLYNTNDQKEDYDVFISYRREGGSELARNIYESLKDKYKIFMDVEGLGKSYFDEKLLNTIHSTKNFIVVLNKDCLGRCSSPEDWLRKEVTHAVLSKKNIIAVATEDFKQPNISDIPKEMQDIFRHDIIYYNHNYFSAMLGKINARIEEIK